MKNEEEKTPALTRFYPYARLNEIKKIKKQSKKGGGNIILTKNNPKNTNINNPPPLFSILIYLSAVFLCAF